MFLLSQARRGLEHGSNDISMEQHSCSRMSFQVLFELFSSLVFVISKCWFEDDILTPHLFRIDGLISIVKRTMLLTINMEQGE